MLTQEDIRQKSVKKEALFVKKIKSLAAVFLALFILAAIPTQAFAAETHEGVATMHTHQWRLDHYDTTYIPIDDETHLKTVYPVYYCTVSGCTNSYLGMVPLQPSLIQ